MGISDTFGQGISEFALLHVSEECHLEKVWLNEIPAADEFLDIRLSMLFAKASNEFRSLLFLFSHELCHKMTKRRGESTHAFLFAFLKGRIMLVQLWHIDADRRMTL